jgi:hypothetical protein
MTDIEQNVEENKLETKKILRAQHFMSLRCGGRYELLMMVTGGTKGIAGRLTGRNQYDSDSHRLESAA